MASPLREKRRVDALFKALGSDFLLREQFVTDPAQIVNEYVVGERLGPDAAAAANQLVYAAVSNPGLLKWLQEYGQSRDEVPSGEAFARDFAGALAQHGDEQTMLALVRGATEQTDLFSTQASVLRSLISALAGSRGNVFAGTEMSSPGTEMSPGNVFAGTEMSSPGTEMSPGHGTEMSPGNVFAGTEMSSPGTEMSPGHGTEMSPGRLGGIDIDASVAALVDFANELRRAGALDVIQFR